MHRRQTMRTTVILNQIRERFGYLPIDALAVSCGTCKESLTGMNAPALLGCRVADVSRLALESGLTAGIGPDRWYHAPCHDSLDGHGEALLAGMGNPMTAIPYCCAEAGTLALSRPDIAAAMRARKRAALQHALGRSTAENIVLTNCPACLSGLGRSASLGFKARHLAEELAIGLDGEGWIEQTKGWRKRAQAVAL